MQNHSCQSTAGRTDAGRACRHPRRCDRQPQGRAGLRSLSASPASVLMATTLPPVPTVSGADYIIANHPVEGVPADRTVIVPDSAKAMIRMASNYRMLFSPKMIGVTGSVGKTTTKEFCYAVLSAFRQDPQNRGQPEQRHRRAQHAVPPDRRYRVRRCRDGHGPRG